MSASDAAALGQRPQDEHPIALICGGGAMPFAVADALGRRGRQAILFPIESFADEARVSRYPHHWISLRRPGRLFSLMGSAGCREAVFIGHVIRPRFSEIGLDWRTIRFLPRLYASFRGGDNRLLSAVGGMLEEKGFRMVGAHEVAPEILVPQGILGSVAPGRHDRSDIARALALLAAIGSFDVGQAAVVANGHVLAIEGIEGTDLMLERIAELRRVGRIRMPPGVGVIVKAPKRGQDHRFDLPTIGPKTIEGVVSAGLAGIAVTAGSAIMVESETLTALANAAGVFVAGAGDDGAIG